MTDEYDYEYDDEDSYWSYEETNNDHSGWAHHLVQARDIHGDVIFFGDEPGYVIVRNWWFSFAAYAALLILAGAYGYAMLILNPGFSDAAKLVFSTCVVGLVFLSTEYRLHGTAFAPLRFLLMVVVVIFGVHNVSTWRPILDLTELLASWMLWRF